MSEYIEITKRVDALQSGDILARPVVSSDKSLSLEKGIRIDATVLGRIQAAGIESVAVYQEVVAHPAPTQAGSSTQQDTFTFIGVERDDVFDADEHCLKIDSPRALQLHEGMTRFAEGILSNISNPDGLDMNHVRENIGAIIGQVHTNPAAMISLVHLRDLDQYTFMHSVNVSVLSIILGKRLGLETSQLEMLGTGSILHDVGKALVSQQILNKPGKLSDEEFVEMKAHAQRGYEILRKRGADEQVSRIALMHHEKLSGRGYPLGLKAEKVPLLARIVAIADVYDALTGDRVYKKAMHPSQAFGLMEQDVGQHLDSSLYTIFKSLLGLYPVSSQVLLANGSIARVISQNSTDPARPVVEVLRTRYGQAPKERVIVNTASSAEYAVTGIHTE